ncbi:transcription factor HES-5-like [Spea bombifrons]|uniref:transcription factor HES-5-like n=1 Tax=Spea bombifrons TaxID=233779 RepID=UPI0023494D94|nr:transcription factor HES-5-like [Spea bombifrons]
MAPSTAGLDHHKMSPKEKNKLRKPAVEKMRRDRINSCIEQLKNLLEKEFHVQQPNVKLEKADILEMTVTYLRKQRLPHANNGAHLLNDAPVDFKDGYSRCFNEVLDFLSLHQKHQATELKLINHFNSNEAPRIPSPTPSRCCPIKQGDANKSSTIWRPW